MKKYFGKFKNKRNKIQLIQINLIFYFHFAFKSEKNLQNRMCLQEKYFNSRITMQ